jgi:hypothetical protein
LILTLVEDKWISSAQAEPIKFVPFHNDLLDVLGIDLHLIWVQVPVQHPMIIKSMGAWVDVRFFDYCVVIYALAVVITKKGPDIRIHLVVKPIIRSILWLSPSFLFISCVIK